MPSRRCCVEDVRGASDASCEFGVAAEPAWAMLVEIVTSVAAPCVVIMRASVSHVARALGRAPDELFEFGAVLLPSVD